ncbi:NAD-dependent epimerase/dehydratase family protein [Alicyclobacillus dauci]|uniref:GDP-mannose 4,6-dehydratase n=1 Tax=Alicyclobacillus dauci TaxID=1475485 RepID=A0ABY6Z670_9BACL|nr:NAD-dependent epimerase/dehydratase family protein [Alicyclobacillus dauci]WAH37520.1 GDP-mannose 4,6-dehydratase [Alicyclobacillus dauci]
MKAVVTGGAGFIGSHLVDELVGKGAEVHIVDNMSSGHFDNVHPFVTFHPVDIRSDEARKIVLHIKPDFIFHLAAQTNVHQSVLQPTYDADVNIVGTLNVLQASQEACVKKVIFASSSAVYGNSLKELISEEDVVAPVSYYGLSKLSAESYIRLFHQLYGLQYTILRYGNVYGPRQAADGEGAVVSAFVERIKQGLPVRIHGDGNQTRDFIYVKDVVRANIAAVSRGTGETIHVSTAQRTPVNHLVKMLEVISGSKISTVRVAERNGDIKHSCLDNTRARELLLWHPRIDIFRGLTETCNFSRSK